MSVCVAQCFSRAAASMHLSIAVSLAAVLVCIFHQVHSFPSGAPSQACDTLSPDPQRHGADPTPIPCPGPSCPYELVLLDRTEPTYTCGETIRLRRKQIMNNNCLVCQELILFCSAQFGRVYLSRVFHPVTCDYRWILT